MESKESAILVHNQCCVALKLAPELVAYTEGSGINEKIGPSCVIEGNGRVIIKFLGSHICSTVYMGETARYTRLSQL